MYVHIICMDDDDDDDDDVHFNIEGLNKSSIFF